jgi:hypothetical protein
VTAEVALENPSVGRSIEDGPPGLEFAHAFGGLLGVQLRHAPVVHVLAAAHGVGEVHAPVVPVVHVAHGGRHATLGHDRVGLAEQRLGDHRHADALRRRLDRRTEPGAAGADHEHISFDDGIVHTESIRKP